MTRKELSHAVKKGLLGSAHNAELCFPPGFRDVAMQEAMHITETFHTPKKFQTQIEIYENALFAKNISFDNLIELTLRCRVVWDVKMEIARKRCANFSSLQETLEKLPWENTLLPETPLILKTLAQASAIENARKVKECAKTILEKRGFPCLSDSSENDIPAHAVPVHISVEKNVLHIGVSLAGLPLYKRGYRALTSSLAPLREDIAAACIKQCRSWAKPSSLTNIVYAPFAGSGTLGLEASLEFLGILESDAPRTFAFQSLTAYREASLQWLKRKLRDLRTDLPEALHVTYVERSPQQHKELLANISHFEKHFAIASQKVVTEAILGDVFEFELKHPFQCPHSLFIAMNPPFGIRMGKNMASVPDFFNRIGKHVQHLEHQFRVSDSFVFGFVLCPSEESWSAFLRGVGKLETKTVHFMLGGRDIRLCMFKTRQSRH
jgi:23S rRNA G2445 N2-methylase RlmL